MIPLNNNAKIITGFSEFQLQQFTFCKQSFDFYF